MNKLRYGITVSTIEITPNGEQVYSSAMQQYAIINEGIPEEEIIPSAKNYVEYLIKSLRKENETF